MANQHTIEMEAVMRRPAPVNGDEQDCFGPHHLMHGWRPGERKRIKRRANKRYRRAGRAEARREAW
jgi:hypothetical protein